ncbi:GyrI-like domain-containing protein [Streptomyces sp. WMMB 322]|uniref:GyrI-like domain-containing protein n=1 Tax=Streptomyces sp. WMMB 322 TaxID=1286821 RepID=UPI0006E30E49|nr:GyrI-like domain-containing protein [Streptomyces sp. WMMB 322]SCK19173.1 effector-binding domain-containing protein [Streptomyces sp. WMMB 322]
MNSDASRPGTGAGSAGPELVAFGGALTAVVRGVVPLAGLRDFFDASFRALGETLARQQVTVTGPAFGFYREPPKESADLEVGFATDRPVRPEGGVVAGSLPAARVARLVHHGSFDDLGASWERLHSWTHGQGLKPGPGMWEVYLTEPSPDMDPRDLRTELNLPVTE